MAGRTRATRGKLADANEEQAAAATAVMSLSEKREFKEEKLDAEAEGDDEEEEQVDVSAVPDDMVIDQQLEGQGSAQENGSMVPDISSNFAPPPMDVPNPEEMLPTVDVVLNQTGKDGAQLSYLLSPLRNSALGLKNHLFQPVPENPSWSHSWSVLRSSFDVIKSPFIAPGSVTLDLEQLKSIFDESTAEIAVLSMSLANIAAILDTLFRHEEGDEDLKAILELMDNGFPFSVVHSTGISVDWLDNNDYIGVGLDIRVQRWMLELDGLDKTDVVNVFKRIFLNASVDPSHDWDGDMSKLIEANWKEIGDFDMTELTNDENDEVLRNKVMSRVQAVFEFANSQNDPDGQLTKFHEVTPFVQELRRFIIKTFDEVDRAYLAKTRQKLPGGEADYEEGSQHPAYGEASRNRNLYDGLSSLSRFSRLGQSEFARSRKRRAVIDASGEDSVIRKVPQKRQRRSMITPAQQLAQMQAAAASAAAAQSAASQQLAPSTIMTHGSPGGSTIISNITDASGKRKELQKRFFWGPVDTDKLCDFIDRYGCNWARISKEATFEIPRTQQQLRDKARNLKVDMLRHDKILLPGFDNVGLHLKEQTLVRKHNKNPFRKEKDVDEDGNPINTEWQEGMDDEYEDTSSAVNLTMAATQASAIPNTQPIDTAAVTDPSLGAAAASMASMASMADPNTLAAAMGVTDQQAAQQQITATLQQSPEEIKQRVQDRFLQIQQSTSLSYHAGDESQDTDMGGAGMHVPVTGAGSLM